jgi:hypothetical protein
MHRKSVAVPVAIVVALVLVACGQATSVRPPATEAIRPPATAEAILSPTAEAQVPLTATTEAAPSPTAPAPTPIPPTATFDVAPSPTPLPATPSVAPSPTATEMPDYVWSQLLDRDDIAPIYSPEFVSADAAGYGDEELVMGVVINGEAKAYPVGLLNWREMVNDQLGGIPILVTW